MLRIYDATPGEGTQQHYLCIDKKKRQITLTDPSALAANTAATQERGPMVAAPKIFAFDNLFTHEDSQTDVSASALAEVIPAVLEGTDGCLLTLGYPNAGECRDAAAFDFDCVFIRLVFPPRRSIEDNVRLGCANERVGGDSVRDRLALQGNQRATPEVGRPVLRSSERAGGECDEARYDVEGSPGRACNR